MYYKRFEDLPVWQNARELAKSAHGLISASEVNRIFKLRDQIYGSSGSIMDNISEGFERNGNRELIQHLYHAKGSAGEYRSQLYRCLDCGFIKEPQFKDAFNQTEKVSAELQNFIAYLEKSDRKGYKFDIR
jgi:four helix bundle protein